MIFTPFIARALAKAPLACALCALSLSALALKTDRTAPMDMKADRWSGDLLKGQQVFEGNVQISQGSLKIIAVRAKMRYENGEVGSAVLEGNPATVTQTREGGGEVRAQAKTINYDLAANKVTLIGAVHIEENGNTTTGERFEYALDSGAIAGNGGTGQVTMRLVPIQKAKSPQ
jgi:lipopolysaccharide export system protein LptA